MMTRRQFAQRAASAALLMHVPCSVARAVHPAGATHPVLPGTAADSSNAQRIDEGWAYRQGPLSIEQAQHLSSGWEVVSLPHCVNHYDACDPDTPYFQGEGWYRKQLTVRNPFPGGRTLLHFQGAGQSATVWAAGQLLGTHHGGYDEFVFDISGVLKARDSQAAASAASSTVDVVVCCSNAVNPSMSPSILDDFCLYGGIYRHVHLVYVPPLALDTVHVLPTVGVDGPAEIKVLARLLPPAKSEAHQGVICRLTTEILSPNGDVLHAQTVSRAAWRGLQQIAEAHIAEPERWGPETPHLYRCRVTLQFEGAESRAEERFGIRHTEFREGGPFLLNGERVLLRGTHRHVDQSVVAAAMPDEQVRQEMQMIRDMGANFIRLAHYQQDRLVLDLCDELGLMVWEEVPWCREGIGLALWQNNTRTQLERMIDQHMNHPAVIFWSLGNEDDWPGERPDIDKAAIRAYMTELRDLSHTLDPSRLTACRRCDFARDIPDVYSPSLWAGWYNGTYHEYEAGVQKARGQVARFIHIEWGADSHAGRHSEDPYATLGHIPTGTGTEERRGDYLRTGGPVRVSKDGDYSETYACDLFDWYLKTQETLPWLSGSAQWIFKDFASPLRADSPIPKINQKGLVQRDLTRKESYAVFQSYWSPRPMIYIYGHTWPRRWGAPGEQRLVRVYSNCPSAELFLNGTSLGVRTRDSQDFPCAGLRWDAVFTPGPNHLRAIGHSVHGAVTDEIELFYQTEAWGDPAVLRLTAGPRVKGVVTVQAELLDAAGVPCLDARNKVHFAATGAALIDNLGTTRGSRQIELYNGRAEISLRQNGPSMVTVTSPGLPRASLAVP